MKSRYSPLALAPAFLLIAGPAMAFTGFATAELNIRTGPGTQYPVAGMVAYDTRIDVAGCLQDISWCSVTSGGMTGWAAGEYLAYDAPGGVVNLPSAGNAVGIPVVNYEAVDAVVAAPVGVVVSVAGVAPVAAVVVPDNVLSFVTAQTVAPVVVTGEIVVGVTLPAAVPLYAIPESPYQFSMVNGQRVLVETNSRQVAYIFR